MSNHTCRACGTAIVQGNHYPGRTHLCKPCYRAEQRARHLGYSKAVKAQRNDVSSVAILARKSWVESFTI